MVLEGLIANGKTLEKLAVQTRIVLLSGRGKRGCDASDYGEGRSGLWTRGILVRRNIADQGLAFFSTWALRPPIELRVEGCR
jgi:hypothetical protein